MGKFFSRFKGIPDTDDPMELVKGGIVRMSRDLGRSLKYFEGALKLDPNCKEALYYKGKVLSIRHRTSHEARKCFQQVIELDTDFAEAYLAIGLLDNYEGQIERARINFEKALKIDPNETLALFKLGELDFEEKKYKKALEYYKKVESIDKEYCGLTYRLATTYRNIKEQDKALEYYDQLIETDEEYSQGLCEQGQIMLERNEYESAIICFETAIKVTPTLWLAKLFRCVAIEKIDHGSRRGAKKCYKKLIKEYEDLCKAIMINPQASDIWVYANNFLRNLDKKIDSPPRIHITDSTPVIHITGLKKKEKLQSAEDQATDDPILRANEFLGLNFTPSEHNSEKTSVEMIYEKIIRRYKEYRSDFELRSKFFEITEDEFQVLNQAIQDEPENDLLIVKVAYCHLMKANYLGGLQILSEISSKNLSEEVLKFLTELYFFKIQNPFAVDAIALMRGSEQPGMSITEYLTNNHSQFLSLLKTSFSEQDRMINEGAYQMNIVLLLVLARLLKRDENEIQILENYINLKAFGEQIRQKYSKFVS